MDKPSTPQNRYSRTAKQKSNAAKCTTDNLDENNAVVKKRGRKPKIKLEDEPKTNGDTTVIEEGKRLRSTSNSSLLHECVSGNPVTVKIQCSSPTNGNQSISPRSLGTNEVRSSFPTNETEFNLSKLQNHTTPSPTIPRKSLRQRRSVTPELVVEKSYTLKRIRRSASLTQSGLQSTQRKRRAQSENKDVVQSPFRMESTNCSYPETIGRLDEVKEEYSSQDNITLEYNDTPNKTAVISFPNSGYNMGSETLVNDEIDSSKKPNDEDLEYCHKVTLPAIVEEKCVIKEDMVINESNENEEEEYKPNLNVNMSPKVEEERCEDECVVTQPDLLTVIITEEDSSDLPLTTVIRNLAINVESVKANDNESEQLPKEETSESTAHRIETTKNNVIGGSASPGKNIIPENLMNTKYQSLNNKEELVEENLKSDLHESAIDVSINHISINTEKSNDSEILKTELVTSSALAVSCISENNNVSLSENENPEFNLQSQEDSNPSPVPFEITKKISPSQESSQQDTLQENVTKSVTYETNYAVECEDSVREKIYVLEEEELLVQEVQENLKEACDKEDVKFEAAGLVVHGGLKENIFEAHYENDGTYNEDDEAHNKDDEARNEDDETLNEDNEAYNKDDEALIQDDEAHDKDDKDFKEDELKNATIKCLENVDKEVETNDGEEQAVIIDDSNSLHEDVNENQNFNSGDSEPEPQGTITEDLSKIDDPIVMEYNNLSIDTTNLAKDNTCSQETSNLKFEMKQNYAVDSDKFYDENTQYQMKTDFEVKALEQKPLQTEQDDKNYDDSNIVELDETTSENSDYDSDDIYKDFLSDVAYTQARSSSERYVSDDAEDNEGEDELEDEEEDDEEDTLKDHEEEVSKETSKKNKEYLETEVKDINSSLKPTDSKDNENVFETEEPITYDKALEMINKDRDEKINDDEFFEMFTEELNRVSAEENSDSDIAIIVDEWIPENVPKPKPVIKGLKKTFVGGKPRHQIVRHPLPPSQNFGGHFRNQLETSYTTQAPQPPQQPIPLQNFPHMQGMNYPQGPIYDHYNTGFSHVDSMGGQVMYNQFGAPSHMPGPQMRFIGPYGPRDPMGSNFPRVRMYNHPHVSEPLMYYSNEQEMQTNLRNEEAMRNNPLFSHLNNLHNPNYPVDDQVDNAPIQEMSSKAKTEESTNINADMTLSYNGTPNKQVNKTKSVSSASEESDKVDTPVLDVLNFKPEQIAHLKKVFGIIDKSADEKIKDIPSNTPSPTVNKTEDEDQESEAPLTENDKKELKKAYLKRYLEGDKTLPASIRKSLYKRKSDERQVNLEHSSVVVTLDQRRKQLSQIDKNYNKRNIFGDHREKLLKKKTLDGKTVEVNARKNQERMRQKHRLRRHQDNFEVSSSYLSSSESNKDVLSMKTLPEVNHERKIHFELKLRKKMERVRKKQNARLKRAEEVSQESSRSSDSHLLDFLLKRETQEVRTKMRNELKEMRRKRNERFMQNMEALKHMSFFSKSIDSHLLDLLLKIETQEESTKMNNKLKKMRRKRNKRFRRNMEALKHKSFFSNSSDS